MSTFSDYDPALFREAFPNISDDDISWLAITLEQLITSVQENHLRKLFEAYHTLNQRFSAESQFWQCWREYLTNYENANQNYQSFINKSWIEYTEEVALEIIKGQTGLYRIIIVGLSELDGNNLYQENLIEAIEYYGIARYLFKSLFDWNQDIQRGQPSLLLTQVLEHAPPPLIDDGYRAWHKKMDYILHTGKHHFAIHDMSLKYLKMAENLTDVPALLWGKKIENYQSKLQSYFWRTFLYQIPDTKSIKGDVFNHLHNRPRFFLNLPKTVSSLLASSLDFLIQHWRSDFSETVLSMVFREEAGFRAGNRLQEANIFQRALIDDVLCDVNEVFNGLLQPILEYEAEYFLQSELNDEVGGWNFFPNLPELSQDADTIAQVAQVIYRTGKHKEVAECVEESLKILFRDNGYANGSFETWIIPTQNRTEQQERQAEAAQTKWGTGADPEVMGNFLYWLYIYDKERFSNQISNGIDYLISCQHPEGYWASTWYTGPFYGTYVIARLLYVARPDSSAIDKALAFIRKNKNMDNGWGLTVSRSDPLSTALALLALSYRANVDQHIIQGGFHFLQNTQQVDGSWQAEPLIQMNIGRANGKITNRIFHGSHTLTTAFVIKAILRYSVLS